MEKAAFKVLIVEDTVVYQKILKEVLAEVPDVKVIGTAENGKIAVGMVKKYKPDIVTLDVEMPVMDGISALRQLKEENILPCVIMVSSLTKEGARVTLDALDLGAFDFITKPDQSDQEQNVEILKRKLGFLIKAYISKKRISSILKKGKLAKPDTNKKQAAMEAKAPPFPAVLHATESHVDAVVMGASTGGPNALANLIPRFPADFPIPILIIQHMPALFTSALADSLDARSRIKVQEGEDGLIIEGGNVYIAPGGKQMKVVLDYASYKYIIQITDDPPENFCKPSVDYLFRSVSKVYKSHAIGIILTGMGNDGTLGLRLMKRYDCTVYAQNDETSVVFSMPHSAIKAGVVNKVLPIERIAEVIIAEVNRRNSL
ncbi:chemotaxis response regulator protein-glutamate methylesterase [Spirochaetota bacterium]